jgi:hypothetical protein
MMMDIGVSGRDVLAVDAVFVQRTVFALAADFALATVGGQFAAILIPQDGQPVVGDLQAFLLLRVQLLVTRQTIKHVAVVGEAGDFIERGVHDPSFPSCRAIESGDARLFMYLIDVEKEGILTASELFLSKDGVPSVLATLRCAMDLGQSKNRIDWHTCSAVP